MLRDSETFAIRNRATLERLCAESPAEIKSRLQPNPPRPTPAPESDSDSESDSASDSESDSDVDSAAESALAPQWASILMPDRFGGVDVDDLEQAANDPVDWLVQGVFSTDQPTIFGAASKAGKTTQLFDMAISLATGEKWLGHFIIPKPRKVLMITGESNLRAASKRIRKALAAKGLDWNAIKHQLRIEAVHFPQLGSERDQLRVAEQIKKHNIEVVILDPLYRGLGGMDTNRLNDMGAAIVGFFRACQPAALVLSHHTTKAAARELGSIPTLENLSGAGVAESCGNWWLMSRNTAYRFDGQHDLCVTYGGRDEQSGVHRIEFDETNWTFTVTSGQDLKAGQERGRQERKQAAEQDKLSLAKAEIERCLANQVEFHPKIWIENRTKSPQRSTRMAVAEMLSDDTLIEGKYLDAKGRMVTGLGLPELENKIDAR